MFSIYTPQGRTFSGPLEQLRRVEKLSHVEPIRHPVDTLLDEDVPSKMGGQKQTAISKRASEEYQSMLAEKGQPEPILHAYQIMSTPVITLQSDWILSQAGEQFKNFPYQMFPVINDYQQLVGTLSRQAFYELLLTSGQPEKLLSRSVQDCFLNYEYRTYAVDPVTDVRRMARLMIENKIEALPVVKDDGQIVGLVSRTDILRSTTTDPPLSLWC